MSRRESKAASGLVHQGGPWEGQAVVPRGCKCPGLGLTDSIKGLSPRPDVTSFWPGAVRYTLICTED